MSIPFALRNIMFIKTYKCKQIIVGNTCQKFTVLSKCDMTYNKRAWRDNRLSKTNIIANQGKLLIRTYFSGSNEVTVRVFDMKLPLWRCHSMPLNVFFIQICYRLLSAFFTFFSRFITCYHRYQTVLVIHLLPKDQKYQHCNFLLILVFCSTSLPLASTRWVRSSHCSLS